jgi:hypothetical protein
MAKADISQLRDIHLPRAIDFTWPASWVMIVSLVLGACLLTLFGLYWWQRRKLRHALQSINKIQIKYHHDGDFGKAIKQIKIIICDYVKWVDSNLNIQNLYGIDWHNFILKFSKKPLPEINWFQIWHDIPYEPVTRVSLNKQDLSQICNFIKIWLKDFPRGIKNV